MRITKHSLRHNLRFQKIKCSFEKWKLDWLGVEDDDDEKKTRIFFKACRICGQRVAKWLSIQHRHTDFIKGNENIKKYMAFCHQAPSNTPSPTVNDNRSEERRVGKECRSR